MPHKLSALSSRFRFDDSNYNYTNTNTNVSSHLCNYSGIDPAGMAKNHDFEKSVGSPSGEDDLCPLHIIH